MNGERIEQGPQLIKMNFNNYIVPNIEHKEFYKQNVTPEFMSVCVIICPTSKPTDEQPNLVNIPSAY